MSHSERVVGSVPTHGLFLVEFACLACACMVHSGFIPQFKVMHADLTGSLKLTICVALRWNGAVFRGDTSTLPRDIWDREREEPEWRLSGNRAEWIKLNAFESWQDEWLRLPRWNLKVFSKFSHVGINWFSLMLFYMYILNKHIHDLLHRCPRLTALSLFLHQSKVQCLGLKWNETPHC